MKVSRRVRALGVLWHLGRLAAIVGLVLGTLPSQVVAADRLPGDGEIEQARQRYEAEMRAESNVTDVVVVKVHRPDLIEQFPNDPTKGRYVWLFVSHTYKNQTRGNTGVYYRRATLSDEAPWAFARIEDYPVERLNPGMSLADYVSWRLREERVALCWPGEPCTITPAESPPEVRPEIAVTATPGYDLSWAEPTAYPLRLRFTSTVPERWTIDKVCDIREHGGTFYAIFYSTERDPCKPTGGVPELVVNYTFIQWNSLDPGQSLDKPVEIPETARVTVLSSRGGIIEQDLDWKVNLTAAYKLYVLRHGKDITGAEAAVALHGTPLPLRQNVSGFWGQKLVLPIGSAVGVRFLDGTAGMIFAPESMDSMYEDVYLPMGAAEGNFVPVDGASVGDLMHEVGGQVAENVAQDRILSALLRKLSGPVGSVLDFSGAVPAGRSVVRIRMR